MNCETPLVSVLMLTYNHASYISEAIESVLGQQTDYPFELVICDDASSDGTQDVARRYAEDPRVILSFQPRNTKFGKNFVDGAARIRGTYVAFCEGDDYWTHPQKLQRQVSFLEAHPDFSVCAHKVQILQMNDRQPKSAPQFVYKDCSADEERIKEGVFYADEAIANYYFQTGSLVLRWCFKEGFPHWFRKRMMFDHFMFMLHAVNGKIKYFDEPMSVWRRHGGGYTWLQTQDKGLFFQKEGHDWIAMYENMDRFFSQRFTWQIRERILLALRSIATNCLQTGNVDQLRLLVKKYEGYFTGTLKDAVLIDALRLTYPERREFAPPWESTPPSDRENPAEEPLEEMSQPAQPTAQPSDALGGCMPFALDDIPTVKGSVWDIWTGDEEYARFFNLRSALMRYLWEQGVDTIWLPTYLPPIVENNRFLCQFKRKFYGVGNRLEPAADFLSEVASGDAVVTIPYLGKPLPDEFCAALAARKNIVWVEDRAQCLFPGQTSLAQAVIYSPRKLVGVPDGGLLVGKGCGALESWCLPDGNPALAQRYARMGDSYGRATNHAENLRSLKFELEHQLSRHRMSPLTESLLRRIPLEEIKYKRQANWQTLYGILHKFCLWPIESPTFAPFAFPLLVPQGLPAEILHTLLMRENIYGQRMWYPLDLPRRMFPLEETLSKRLLLLPCDQRYGKADMERIGASCLRLLRSVGFASPGENFSVSG